ncbi:chitobiase/beta-hexosaminidase C-terminal domain-containing protein [Candidatus Woesebacteria bacterium]|nr:chitobiase/beta-hexosaminidase C-terminal domain-containing protein [Candidatus Woesebacteria bacterium]
MQLPLPEGADENSQLVYAESVAELNSAQKIESGEIVSETMVAEGLDHFTVFVVVYNTMPEVMPGSYPSLGFQATQTSEFGDHLQLAGLERQAERITVELTNWACENDFTSDGSGGWTPNRANTDACVTTPGSSYVHPITLNVYEVDNSGLNPAVGPLIVTKTVDTAVPFRPSYDIRCTAPGSDVPFGGTWYDEVTDSCVHGFNFDVPFDLNGEVLPEEVIVTVAYNTQSYGNTPIGANGPYNSLNVAVGNVSPSVGINVDPDDVFWNTSTASSYTDGGPGGILRRDTNWSTYVPIIKIETSAPVVTTIEIPKDNVTWLFNRDLETASPFEFNTDQSVIGTGSLYAKPIANTYPVATKEGNDKFIAEDFIMSPIADINKITYDYMIGSGGAPSDANHFYMSVYANFGESPANKYYDCRYSVVPTVGSTSGFTTVTFDPSLAYPVATRTGGEASPHTCPAIPADMDSLSPGSTIRVYALNMGDTSMNDTGLDGYFDNVVIDKGSEVTVYDFEPMNLSAPNNLGWNLRSKSTIASERPVDVVCGLTTNADYQTYSNGMLAHNWETADSVSNLKFQRQWMWPGSGSWTTDGTVYSATNTNFATLGSASGTEGTWNTRVRSWVDQNGNNTFNEGIDLVSGWSNECQVTYDRTAPNAPTLSSPADGAWVTGNPTQTWNPVADAHHYIYESYLDSSLSTPAYTTTVNGTSRTVGGNQTVTFWWRVKAVDAAGNESPWSDDWQLNVDNTNPSIPANLRYYDPATSVELPCSIATTPKTLWPRWNANSEGDFSHYEYTSYDAINSAPGWKVGLNEVVMTSTEFQHSWVPPIDGTYGFAVRAVDLAGNKSAWAVGGTKTLADSCQYTVDRVSPTVDLVFPTPGVSATSFQAVFSENVNETDAENPANYHLNNWPGAGGSGDLVGDANIVYDASSKTATITFIHSGWYVSPEQQWGVQNVHDLANNLQVVNPYQEYSTPMVDPVTIDSGIDSNWHNTSVAFSLNCTDIAGSGCKNTYYTTDGSDPTTGSAIGNAIVLSADGQYVVKYFSTDNAGNTEEIKMAANMVKIDTIAPDVAVTTPVAGLLSGTVPIRGTVTDVNPHHYWFVIQNSGGTVVAGPGTINESNSFTDQLLLNWNTTGVVDGTYTIKLEARDSAENKDAGSVSWVTVTVDNTAPVTTLSTPVTDQKSNQAIEIAGNSTDTNGVNFVNLYYSVADADSWTLIDTIDNTVDSTSFDFSYDWTPAEGKYDIKVEATDVLGNVEHTAYAYDVIYDVTDPSSEITTFDLGDGEEIETTTFDGLLEGTATDLPTDIASGVDHVLLSISHFGFGEDESNTKYWDATGSAWVSEQSLFSATGAETWSYQLSDTPEGFYTVVSHAVDRAGNVEDTYTIKIVYDKTIPEVNLTIDPTNPNGNNGWYKTLPTITLTANDNYFVDHIEYQWNSTVGSWTTYSAPITPPGEGQNILYYRAVDTVGNVSGNGIKEVKFDKTVPANGPLNVRVENIGSVEALGKWDKPNGDEQVHEYRVSWRHPVSGTEYSDFVSASTFEHKLVNLFDGVWEFKVQLLDAAGNNKEATAQFRVGSDPSAVLGATTDQNVGTGTGGTFFNTQQVSQEDEVEDAGSAEEKAEAEAAGTVLGESDDTCAPWQFYLPLFLLLIQALLAISLEFINKELSAKKLLFAILISGLMIGAYYMLRDPSCYSGGSAMQSLAKFFVPLSLLLAFVLRVIGSLTVEEK